MYALEVAHLSVHFEGAERPAVEDVSFALEPGQMIMLIGPNGSGKTTLLRAILGLIPCAGGGEGLRPTYPGGLYPHWLCATALTLRPLPPSYRP
jgi:ABC-type branched-subunit amino acid transport system ATPase component